VGVRYADRIDRNLGALRLASDVSERALLAVADRLVFSACGDHGCEPWNSDGTPAGTRRLADIALGST
jgi:ELWxxDGT repeat protein